MPSKLAIQSLVASAVLGLALALSAGPASAGGSQCDPKKQDCTPECDPKKEDCTPECDPKKEDCTPECDPKKEDCTPECDPKKEDCTPVSCDPKKESCDLCHNIGGPRALGANCDAGNCDSILDTGNDELISLYNEAVGACVNSGDCNPENIYGGIVVPHSANAIAAHARHGDGPTLVIFDRIHDTQPHVSANVGCFAERVLEDPGN